MWTQCDRSTSWTPRARHCCEDEGVAWGHRGVEWVLWLDQETRDNKQGQGVGIWPYLVQVAKTIKQDVSSVVTSCMRYDDGWGWGEVRWGVKIVMCINLHLGIVLANTLNLNKAYQNCLWCICNGNKLKLDKNWMMDEERLRERQLEISKYYAKRLKEFVQRSENVIWEYWF